MLSHLSIRKIVSFLAYITIAVPFASSQAPVASPSHAAVGATVVIKGSGFGAYLPGTSAVTFHGVPAAVVPANWLTNQISVQVPAGATTGTLTIVVGPAATPTEISAGAFTIDLPVHINPAIALPGDNLEISGAFPGATLASTSATVGGQAASVWSVSSSLVKLTVPAGAVSGDVVLIIPGGPTNVGKFTLATPTLNPNHGSIGTHVTLSGAMFGASRGTVTVGGNTAEIVSWDTESVVINVPACMASGQQKVEATVGGSPIELGNFTVDGSVGWSDLCDENPLGITIVGGYEQGYSSSESSNSDGFLAFYGRRLFPVGNGLWGPFYSVRLQTAPVASGTDGVVSVLTNPTGGVTTAKLSAVGQAVDLNVGIETHLFDRNEGQTSFDWIFGGGFVTPVLGNQVQQAFTMPTLGTVECTSLQANLKPTLAKPQYANISTTAPTGASGRSCFWNTAVPTPGTGGSPATPGTMINTLAYATPDRTNFFGKAYTGLKIVNRWPLGSGQSQCPCERGQAVFALGQNASITGGYMRHLVFTIDVIHPLPVPSVKYIYFFGSISKRLFDNTPAQISPIVLAAVTPVPTASSASTLMLPLTQPDRDFYRIGGGISLNQIFTSLTK